LLAQPFEEVPAVQHRHQHVQNDQVRAGASLEEVEGFLPVGGHDHLEALLPENDRQALAGYVVIVHHHDSFADGRHRITPAASQPSGCSLHPLAAASILKQGEAQEVGGGGATGLALGAVVVIRSIIRAVMCRSSFGGGASTRGGNCKQGRPRRGIRSTWAACATGMSYRGSTKVLLSFGQRQGGA